MVLISGCSFPYRINTRQVAKKERAEIHPINAEILYVDGKMVSVNKFLWFLSEHVVITKGKHELIVDYWERSIRSKSTKKLHVDAKPGGKYYVQCSKKRAGKASEQKSRDDKYLTKRRGGDYYTDKQVIFILMNAVSKTKLPTKPYPANNLFANQVYKGVSL